MHEVPVGSAFCMSQANPLQTSSSLHISACVRWPSAKARVRLMLTGSAENIKWLFLSLTCPESHLLTYPFHKTEYGKSSPRKTKSVQKQ